MVKENINELNDLKLNIVKWFITVFGVDRSDTIKGLINKLNIFEFNYYLLNALLIKCYFWYKYTLW